MKNENASDVDLYISFPQHELGRESRPIVLLSVPLETNWAHIEISLSSLVSYTYMAPTIVAFWQNLTIHALSEAFCLNYFIRIIDSS